MDGILIVDKPQWLTSHDVVLKLRQKLSQQRIGHAGTLDPLATGVLVLVLGRATKLVPKLINQDKKYEVTMTLGIKTDSGDITGKIIKKEEFQNIDLTKIKDIFSRFKGQLVQTPPMVSAKKYKGKPLYKYARQGKVIPRAPKEIHIYSLTLEEIKLPEVSFSVHCSKGTYIRTLCEDIGESIGPGACANKIHRIKSGPFSIGMAEPLDKLLSYDIEGIQKHLITPNPALLTLSR